MSSTNDIEKSDSEDGLQSPNKNSTNPNPTPPNPTLQPIITSLPTSSSETPNFSIAFGKIRGRFPGYSTQELERKLSPISILCCVDTPKSSTNLSTTCGTQACTPEACICCSRSPDMGAKEG
ncbi:hypothetical protein BDZ45DRAFT_246649 [Acephala macrosclerotiorum]|nr:hypothetical protein BDZ45DRAFT_246649 [Acephala macrosclerotiorum]